MSSTSASTPIAPIPISKHESAGLLTWKDPQRTAKVFGVSLASLLALRYVNLVNLFFRFAFISLFVAGAGEYAGKLVTGSGFASRFRPAHCNSLSSAAHHYLPKVEKAIAQLEAQFQAVFFAADIEKTLKFAALSYVLYKITAWFSVFSLLVSSLVLAFTVPVAYVTYEKEIHQAKDKYYSLAKSKASEYRDVAHQRSKPFLAQANSKLSPYTSKVSGYLPKNRTAGSTVGSSASASPAAPKPQPESSVGSASGASVHQTNALPKAPTTDPLASEHLPESVDVDELKASIQKNKASVGI